MSTEQIRKFARQFIDEQKKILEEHGDAIVRSKYKAAIRSAQRTFEEISAKPSQRPTGTQVKS